MAVSPTKPTTTLKLPAVSAQAPDVTPKVTEPVIVSPSRPIIGIPPRPLFEVTTEDAPDLPPKASVPHVRQMTAKTLAEHEAGRAAISQYVSAE